MRRLGILLMFFLLVLFIVIPASAGVQKQWADLATSVDANGNIITTRVYGYYADVEDFGQVFVVCDPNTGRETGDAFVPGGKIGEKQSQKIVRYDRKQVLDWDHPKQLNPVQVALTMPNIPTSLEYDWDQYEKTGQLTKKVVGQFGWPMDYSFARLVPGSDPDYWLIIASVQNPNPFPVKAQFQTSIHGWRDGWWHSENISKDIEVPLGPNETKYILLNRGKKGEVLTREYGEWDDNSWEPGYSEAYYYAKVNKVEDPEYPDILKTGNEQGFYKPYVRWDGTDPTVLPLVPMRLAFDFYCWSYDEYGSYWYNYYRGREFPDCYGHAEYDPDKAEWTISVGFSYFEKPWWKSDEEWEKIVATAHDKAQAALKPLFEKWYPKVPFWSAWWEDPYLRVDGETGYYITTRKENWPGGRRPSFTITFYYLEPTPPSKLPPGAKSLQDLYGPYWWLMNVRYGGWLYDTYGPYSYGSELPAPTLTGYIVPDGIDEENYTSVSYKDDSVQVPRGAYIYRSRSDVRYYDPDGWMEELFVLRARPVFFEKYTFVSTQGDFGYLKKDAVPGYLLWVEDEDRPYIKDESAVREINVSFDGVNGLKGSYRWTPSVGWQQVHQSSTSSKSGTWNVEVKYNTTLTAINPNDFPVQWKGSGTLYSTFVQDPNTHSLLIRWSGLDWGNPDVYEENEYDYALRDYIQNGKTRYLEDALLSFADIGYKFYDKERIDRYTDKYYWNAYPRVYSYNFDHSLPVDLTEINLGPNETRVVWSGDRTSSVSFTRVRENENISDLLNQISGSVQTVFQNASRNPEVAFPAGTVFTMGKTFKPGEGGVICGAQKVLVYRQWVYKKDRWGDHYWGWDDDLDEAPVGFPHDYWQGGFGPRTTVCSYLSDSSPTDGQVVKADDELLGAALTAGDWARTIRLDRYTPAGSRFWRYFDGGQIYPPDYPGR